MKDKGESPGPSVAHTTVSTTTETLGWTTRSATHRSQETAVSTTRSDETANSGRAVVPLFVGSSPSDASWSMLLWFRENAISLSRHIRAP